ncbi:MAG: hypothetical protein DRR19_27295 [Candidatus Parabeggiatoa sp. nov. 1]|nr:MAG: hypothetical protein DRR19_27295 [Gammaproteobacteria bacterium]
MFIRKDKKGTITTGIFYNLTKSYSHSFQANKVRKTAQNYQEYKANLVPKTAKDRFIRSTRRTLCQKRPKKDLSGVQGVPCTKNCQRKIYQEYKANLVPKTAKERFIRSTRRTLYQKRPKKDLSGVQGEPCTKNLLHLNYAVRPSY